MLDIRFIRENPDLVKETCRRKKQKADIDTILRIDQEKRESIYRVEQLKKTRNRTSEDVAQLKKSDNDASALINEMKVVAAEIKEIDSRLRIIDDELTERLGAVPNMPHASAPRGESEKDNKHIGEWHWKKKYDFEPLDHLQLGEKLDILDFPRGAKIGGSGFPVYKGLGARLERALIGFMLDRHITCGYREIIPPFLANEACHFGTGQLPKSRDQMYEIGQDNLFCIPTAEVPVTNLHREEILPESLLPLKYCAFSACFRREAGSYGKDTKGLLRVHQFNKVELVKFSHPEHSYNELELLRLDAEDILRQLGLHYRILELCDADMSFAAAKCYDLEVWAPGENAYLEVSSCSNFEDFQARRMDIRFRPSGGGKPRYVHTLNGSGVATARLMVALLETFQTPEGTVRLPEPLLPFMNGIEELTPP